MSLDKAIKHNKEHRKPYRGAKAVDSTCRNHGSDDWATDNRLFQRKRAELSVQDRIEDWKEQED